MINELYTEYRSELSAYCFSMCGNINDSEDLVQETFLKALSNLDTLEELGKRQQRAWLYKVARNLFFDRCRRADTERKYAATFDDSEDGGFDRIDTAMVLSGLPPDLSQIFIKRYFQGFTSVEIAKEYGVSASGIRAMLSRARKILKEELAER